MKKTSEATEKLVGKNVKPNKVKFADIEPRAPEVDEADPAKNWDRVLRRLAADEHAARHGMQLSQLRDDLTNYEWRNEVGYHQHNHWYQQHPEEQLYKGAMPLFSGKGAAGDDPATHKFFMESFQDHPEILQMYTRGAAKPRQSMTTAWRAHHKAPHLMVPHSKIV